MKTISSMLIGFGLAAISIAQSPGRLTLMTQEETHAISGAVIYNHQELRMLPCGLSGSPGGTCTRHEDYSIPYHPQPYCEGGCEEVCVNTANQKWCACSLDASTCDSSDEVSCTGGEIYNSPNECDWDVPPCTACNYAWESGWDCYYPHS